MVTRRIKILSSAMAALITGILLLSGCTKTLGEAQIIVYEDGEKIVLDSDSPHYRKLQLACEELLIPAERLYSEDISNVISREEILSREWAVELEYKPPIEQNELAFSSKYSFLIIIDRVLIPLNEELISKNNEIGSYTVLYASEILPINGNNRHFPLKNDASVQKIKEILTKFDIIVP